MDYTALFITLKLALAVTAVLVVLAAPVAYLFACRNFPGKPLLEALLYLPMALPPTVIGFYLVIVMGPRGILGTFWQTLTGNRLLFTFAGITVAAVLYSLPFAVQPMKATFQKIDHRLLESAAVLGLSPTAAFFRVVIPNSTNGIIAAAVLVFLHTIGAFGVLLMVGGSIPGVTKVASIAIYEAVEMMDYRSAGLMALTFLPVSYLFLLFANRLSRDGGHDSFGRCGKKT
ncbi:MAG: molybdate ABC transporter permease subunit [Syntrophales bacterium]|jgi:molybdate transport system permease protein|nr:molybdate ABC transporter permease subunit [Syntrophales bacterium]MCK9527075.1 molybdate ABC transporter permease subunit [Syntrophales bacterium]MDX9921800.1 molybdate ABC transporter permease subunit [Syntrophales bacterium]